MDLLFILTILVCCIELSVSPRFQLTTEKRVLLFYGKTKRKIIYLFKI